MWRSWTALCNHTTRPAFLQALSAEPTVYSNCILYEKWLQRANSLAEWHIARKIQVEEFSLCYYFRFYWYFEYVGQKLKKLCVIGASPLEEVLNAAVAHCLNLAAVTIMETCITDKQVKALSNLPPLQHLNITTCKFLKEDSLRNALPSWPGLLVFQAAYSELRDADIKQLVASCAGDMYI